MNLLEYEKQIEQFVIYNRDVERPYLAHGLISEVGELAGCFAKRLRGDTIPDSAVLLEIGDCLFFTRRIRTLYAVTLEAPPPHIHFVDDAIIRLADTAYRVSARMILNSAVTPLDVCNVEGYLARIAHLHGANLDDVAGMNFRKLADRQARGVIAGNGDKR